jgi:hypothetical protein
MERACVRGSSLPTATSSGSNSARLATRSSAGDSVMAVSYPAGLCPVPNGSLLGPRGTSAVARSCRNPRSVVPMCIGVAMVGVSSPQWLAIPRLRLQGEPFLHLDNHPALIVANCESRRLALSLVSRRAHCRLAPRQSVGVPVNRPIPAPSAWHCNVQCQLAVEPDCQPDTFLEGACDMQADVRRVLGNLRHLRLCNNFGRPRRLVYRACIALARAASRQQERRNRGREYPLHLPSLRP